MGRKGTQCRRDRHQAAAGRRSANKPIAALRACLLFPNSCRLTSWLSEPQHRAIDGLTRQAVPSPFAGAKSALGDARPAMLLFCRRRSSRPISAHAINRTPRRLV